MYTVNCTLAVYCTFSPYFQIKMPWWVWLVGVILAVSATPQSNYDQQAVSINSLGSGIPELATLNGTVTELGMHHENRFKGTVCAISSEPLFLRLVYCKSLQYTPKVVV